MPFDATNFVIAPPVVETEEQRIIREARARIADPALWRQGELAACGRVCMLGALGWDAYPTYEKPRDARDRATMLVARACSMLERDPRPPAKGLGPASVHVFGFNDHHTHSDVLSALDKAYDLAHSDNVRQEKD